MALKRLPNDVQSLLCASAQVNSYKKAIEELVYNSLDAEATSIAIRIHIQDNTIQVIDNGCGITKSDFHLLGEKYMTSKLNDLSTLKAVPKNYGYRGEFLSNTITVSQIVKITSRHESTEETWAKTFYNGKEKKFAKMTTRPTKGTTVDIKGFLYNLNIQKRRTDPINELQNIKSFLEQLSLVKNNISLSLRDDSKNDIVFKIHKKRDIYQTLSTLFEIDRADILELQVEKNEYKVKGLIGKTDKGLDLHWIYLNGKFIHGSSKLHKVINEYIKKYLRMKDQRHFKSKRNNDEHQLFNQNFPFYFVFVTCPYIDYEISFTSKQSIIEFKNWDQIIKLLEKLIKFYFGDINLKEIKKPENKALNREQKDIKYNQDTREQVKQIMNKILRSNSKKLGVSQIQNGVKGKLIKRKHKTKTVKTKANISKLLFKNDNQFNDSRTSSKSKLEINSVEYGTGKQCEHKINTIKENKEIKFPKKIDKKVKRPYAKKKKLKGLQIEKNKKDRRTKTILSTTETYKAPIKPKHVVRKNNNIKEINMDFKTFQSVKETDSVYKRSKIVARKAEEFLRFTQKENVAKNVNKNIFMKETYNNLTIESLLPKKNKCIIDKCIITKAKTKSFKTTYDLLQTILVSQEEMNAPKYIMSKEIYSGFPDFDYRRNEISRCLSRVPKRSTWTNKCIYSKYSDIDGQHTETSLYTISIPAKNKTYGCEDDLSEYCRVYEQNEEHKLMSSNSQKSRVLSKDIYSENQSFNSKQKQTFIYTLSGPIESKLTYESHQYDRNEVSERNDNKSQCTVNKKQNMRFITKQSRENFVTAFDFRNKFHKPSKPNFKRQNKFYDVRMKQTTDESYAIEYSKSDYDNHYYKTDSDIFINCVDVVKANNFVNKANENYENHLTDNQLNSFIANTYTIEPPNFSLGINIESQHQTKTDNFKSNEPFNTYSVHYSNTEINNEVTPKVNTEYENIPGKTDFNIVFVSKSQESGIKTLLDGNMEPLNVCETIFNESGTIEREFAFSFNKNNRLNDSLYNDFGSIDDINAHIQKELLQLTANQGNINVTENISHHFSSAVIYHKKPEEIYNDNKGLEVPKQNNYSKEIIRPENLTYPNFETNINIDTIDCNVHYNDFHLKNRLRFVPKGMSQIFENCRSKSVCDYNLNKDYYEDSIYNNFVNDVQVNTEIYEPVIQNVEDRTTKTIHKFKNKVQKDNASLIFDEKSLKEVKILGQADCKFIAAIMKSRCSEMGEVTEYLILFDQHAVHERIRLEENLAGRYIVDILFDYMNGDRWTSVPLDNIILNMSKDEILYLHNYKDKFIQFGLQWTISNCNEVRISSIPEAILGKNPREVDKVIKAVKNLIVEEINVIKLQKGCVSLYPKSIMDLVFSEACRYAIKFGDQLTKNDCVELLNALSNCKTPFQCAHGRPVMAVIMDIKCDKRDYKVNMAKLSRFKRRNT